MEKIILLVIILVEVIIIFMIENKDYMAIVVSTITMGIYFMFEYFYYKLYIKGSLGYQSFSPIAIIYGIVVIIFILKKMYDAKKTENEQKLKLSRRVLLLIVGLYITGKAVIIYSERGLDQISEEMMKTDFVTSQVFRIIINSLIISYVISTLLKRREGYGERND